MTVVWPVLRNENNIRFRYIGETLDTRRGSMARKEEFAMP